MLRSRNKNTSVSKILQQFSSFRCLMRLRIKAACSRRFSMEVTEEQPRDTNSNAILPVPENRSIAESPSKSKRLDRMLKRFSLAKSVVGRALKLLGTSKRLCQYLPLITRIGEEVEERVRIWRYTGSLHSSIWRKNGSNICLRSSFPTEWSRIFCWIQITIRSCSISNRKLFQTVTR